jgi:hypothetical protein
MLADTQAYILLGTEHNPKPMLVDAWFTDVPGLIVTVAQGNETMYVLTHIPSGRSVGPYVYETVKDARATAAELGDVLEWWRHDGFYNSLTDEQLGVVEPICKRRGIHRFDALFGAAL